MALILPGKIRDLTLTEYNPCLEHPANYILGGWLSSDRDTT